MPTLPSKFLRALKLSILTVFFYTFLRCLLIHRLRMFVINSAASLSYVFVVIFAVISCSWRIKNAICWRSDGAKTYVIWNILLNQAFFFCVVLLGVLFTPHSRPITIDVFAFVCLCMCERLWNTAGTGIKKHYSLEILPQVL